MALFQQYFTRADEVTAFAAGAAASGFIRFPTVGEIVSRSGAEVGATITISDGSASETFEFVRGTAAGGGNVAVDIQAAATRQDVASALLSAIAGTALAVTPAVVESGDDAYLTIINNAVGLAGNVPIVASNKSGRPFEISGMAGGTVVIADNAIISILKVPGGWHLWWTA